MAVKKRNRLLPNGRFEERPLHWRSQRQIRQMAEKAELYIAGHAPKEVERSSNASDDIKVRGSNMSANLAKLRSSAVALRNMARSKRRLQILASVESIGSQVDALREDLNTPSVNQRGDSSSHQALQPTGFYKPQLGFKEVQQLLDVQQKISDLLEDHAETHSRDSLHVDFVGNKRSRHHVLSGSKKEFDGWFLQLKKDKQKLEVSTDTENGVQNDSTHLNILKPSKQLFSSGKPLANMGAKDAESAENSRDGIHIQEHLQNSVHPGEDVEWSSSREDVLMQVSNGPQLYCLGCLKKFSCCRGVTDYERAAVLLDDAINLRSPLHDMESKFQISVWLIMGNWWWIKAIQLITVAFVVILPFASIPFYGIKKSHHVELGTSILLEWLCLLALIFDLSLKGYAYGRFVWKGHHMFKLVSLVCLLHIIDLAMATSHAMVHGFESPPSENIPHPGVSVRWSELFRAILIPYYFSKLRRYFIFTAEAIYALRHVAFFMALAMTTWIVITGLAFPTQCSIPHVYNECLMQSNLSLKASRGYSGEVDQFLQCGKSFDEAGVDDGECGTSFYKNHSGALLAQSSAYLQDTHDIIMQMLFLLLGCVNFPDIALPVSVLSNRIAFMGFAAFIVVMIVVILSLVLSVVFYEFQVSFAKRYDRDWKKYASTLLRSLALVSSNEDGSIDRSTFKQLFQEFKALWGTWILTKNSKLDLDFVFSQVDEDQSGVIDKWEFVNVCNDIFEDDKEQWIMSSKYDMSAKHLDELDRYKEQRNYKGSAGEVLSKPRVPSLRQATVSSAVDAQQQMFEAHHERSTICGRFLTGGTYPQLRRIVVSWWFRWIVQLTTYASCAFALGAVIVKFETDCSHPEALYAAHETSEIFLTAELVFAFIFALEVCIKIAAVGFLGYWHTLWWRFDFFLTLSCIMDIGLALYVQSKDAEIECDTVEHLDTAIYGLRRHMFFRSLRMFRALRLLRYLTYDFHSRRIFRRILKFIPEMFQWVGLLFTLMYPYAVVGVYMWAGKLHFKDDTSPLAQSAFASAGTFSFKSELYGNATTTVVGAYARVINFDDFVNAFFTLFSISFENNWHVIYEGVASVTNSDGETLYNKWLVAAFFVTWIVLSTLVVMNLLISHFLQTFDQHSQKDADMSKRWEAVMSELPKKGHEVSGTSQGQDSCLSRLRTMKGSWCGHRCALTGAHIQGGTETIFMMAPRLGSKIGYEPIPVSHAVALEFLDPTSGSSLNRFLNHVWKPKKAHSEIAKITTDAQILLGKDAVANATKSTTDKKRIKSLYREASSLELTWKADHKTRQSGHVNSKSKRQNYRTDIDNPARDSESKLS